MERLIEKGKIRIIDLRSKREELKNNQILLLKDDLKDVEILLEQKRFRGAYLHAFDALERLIDIALIDRGLKITDRYSRKVAIGEVLGKDFLSEYEELFETRREGMYDSYGIIKESDVNRIIAEVMPPLLKKLNINVD